MCLMDGTYSALIFSVSASVGATQDPSTNDEQSSWCPAHIYGRPQLSSPLAGGYGVVETCDDAVSWPADRNNTQEPCD